MRDIRSPLVGIRSPFGVREWTSAELFADGRPGVTHAPLPGFVFANAEMTTPATLGATAPLWVRSPVAGQPALVFNEALWTVTAGGHYYIEADGVDQFGTTTANVNLSSVSAVTLVMGIEKLSDAAAAVALEASINSTTTAGAVAMFAPGAAAADYRFRSHGTSAATSTASSLPAPNRSVVTGVGAIATDTNLIRVNGTQRGSVATDQGAGSYGNHPLFLFARGGASLFMAGRYYGSTLTPMSAAEIPRAEAYHARLTGVSI